MWNPKLSVISSVLAGAVILYSPSNARATLMQSNASDNTSQTAYTASATDLGDASQTTLLSRSETGYEPFNGGSLGTSTPDALNNGTVGSPTNLNDSAFNIDGTWTTTFTFNTSVNTRGYDIRSIVSIAAWLGDGGGSRVNQQYSVQYTTVGNASPQSLGSFSFYPNFLTGDSSSQITLSDDVNPGVTTIPLLTGVKSLIFNIVPADGVGAIGAPGTVYREIDITGVATVPEPSSAILALFGMGTLLMVRKRSSYPC